MQMPSRKPEQVGFKKPPRKTRFKRGKSGNPNGRPRGSKNFETVLGAELDCQVPVLENGKRKKVSKRQAIAKQLVNKAAGGDLKAAQTVLKQTSQQSEGAGGAPDIFDAKEHRLVMADIVRRIRLMDAPAAIQPTMDGATTEMDSCLVKE